MKFYSFGVERCIRIMKRVIMIILLILLAASKWGRGMIAIEITFTFIFGRSIIEIFQIMSIKNIKERYDTNENGHIM